MTKLLFCTSYKPGALVIRVFTRSRFSHVAIEVDNTIYESRFATGVHKPKHIKNVTDIIELDNLDDESVKAFLEAQVGKKYDSKAICSFMFSRTWEDLNKWFCSELGAMAIKVGGYKGIPNNLSKISPEDLYKIITKYSSFTNRNTRFRKSVSLIIIAGYNRL
jgi:hypothetical protein